MSKGNEPDIKYLAGLFDGEGCAYITRHIDKTYTSGITFRGHLAITMVDSEAVIEFHNRFGGYKFIAKAHKSNDRDAAAWRITGRPAGEVAKQLLPHMLIERKKEALRCVIQIASTVGTKCLTPEVIALRAQLHQRCRKLNAIGRNAVNAVSLDEFQPPEPIQLNFL